MTSTLAGCTGGDPDGGGNDEIDMDILNQLIDDNLQDFINNTTITVENHYHNNTTVVNSNYDYSVSQINGSNNLVNVEKYLLTVNWDRFEYIPLDIANHTVLLNGTLQQYENDNSLLLIEYYNSNRIELRLTCQQLINVRSLGDEVWGYWFLNTYGSPEPGSDLDTVVLSILAEINNLYESEEVRNQCANFGQSWSGGGFFEPYQYDKFTGINKILFEIDLDTGQTLTDLSIQSAEVTVDLHCDGGFTTGLGGDGVYTTSLIGGHDNCTVIGSNEASWRVTTTNEYFSSTGSNEGSSNLDLPEIFGNWSNWPEKTYQILSEPIITGPFDEFNVYFTIEERSIY